MGKNPQNENVLPLAVGQVEFCVHSWSSCYGYRGIMCYLNEADDWEKKVKIIVIVRVPTVPPPVRWLHNKEGLG